MLEQRGLELHQPWFSTRGPLDMARICEPIASRFALLDAGIPLALRCSKPLEQEPLGMVRPGRSRKSTHFGLTFGPLADPTRSDPCGGRPAGEVYGTLQGGADLSVGLGDARDSAGLGREADHPGCSTRSKWTLNTTRLQR